MTVDHARKAVLFLLDGRMLVRQAGFQGDMTMAYGSKDKTAKCPKKSGGKQ